MANSKTLSVIIKAVDALSPTLKTVNASLRTVQGQIGVVGRAGDKLASKLGVPLSLFGLSALGGLGATVKGFAEKGEELSNAVKKIGGSAQDLLVFRKAAELSNIPIDVLDKSLTKLNKNIAEGAAGKNKEFAGLMARLKIPLRDANKQLRTAGDILPELADAFEVNTNAAVRARIASVAFGGKVGAEMIPMLAGGGQGLNEIREKLERFGVVMSDDSVASASKLADSLKWLNIAGRGLGNTIGAALAPVLTPMIEAFTEWVVLNRAILASKVKEFVVKFAAALERVDWKGLAVGASMFGAVLGWMVDLVGGWGNALTIVAVIMNASIIASLLGIVVAIGKAVSAIYSMGAALVALAIANPIVLAIGVAIAALGALAYVVYKNWEPIKEWFVNLWADIKGIFQRNIADLITTIVPFAGLLDTITGGRITASINDAVGYRPVGQAVTAPSLATAGSAESRVKVAVDFRNAPAGMRVSEAEGSFNRGTSVFTDVGYSSAALGMP